MIEGCLKPGNEPPPHVHGREDELFYILEGEMDMYVGNEVFNAGAGECLFLPRLKPHTFVVRSPRLRTLVLFMPGGLEEYFRARSSRAEKLELPSEAVTYSTSDLEPIVRTLEEYGARLLSQDEVAEQMPLYFAALRKRPILEWARPADGSRDRVAFGRIREGSKRTNDCVPACFGSLGFRV